CRRFSAGFLQCFFHGKLLLSLTSIREAAGASTLERRCGDPTPLKFCWGYRFVGNQSTGTEPAPELSSLASAEVAKSKMACAASDNSVHYLVTKTKERWIS